MSTTTEQNVRLAEVIRDVMASGAACFAGRLSEGLVDRNAPMGEALGDFPSEFLAIRPSIIDDLAAALPTPVSASGAAPDTSSSHLPESHGAQCLAVTTFTKVEQAIVAARFLDSLGIAARSLTVTPLGRVECEIDRDDFDRARRVAVNEYAATVHHEPGGVFVEARIDGVPVQLWAGVA